MPDHANRLPYEVMRAKVDLMIAELRELTEMLQRFRDDDFGRLPGQDIDSAAVIVRCKSGFNIISPPTRPCDHADLTFSWREGFGAAEGLVHDLLIGMRQLRDLAGPGSGPGPE